MSWGRGRRPVGLAGFGKGQRLVYVVVALPFASYDGWLWGFLFVVGSLWLHVILLAVLNLLTGGLLSQAFDMGFDVYVRWNVPLIAFMDVSFLYVSCRVMRHLPAYVR
ncbi:MAG: hypothetical protein LM562_07155 [Pyrobaculum sp.]|nr:hypothetical protein [Pyrobaculum sp.]